jgi:hypothetical protein
MAKTKEPQEPVPEKDNYTKEEVQQMLHDAQVRQAEMDSMRIHGNAFFAEALDHIGSLAQKDKFWQTVYGYGRIFKQQFESNTGQAEQPLPKRNTPSKDAKPAKEKTKEGEDDDEGTSGE